MARKHIQKRIAYSSEYISGHNCVLFAVVRVSNLAAMRTASEWQSYNTTRLPLSRIDPKSLYSVMRKRYSGKKSLGSFFSSEAYRSKPCIHLIVQYCLDRLRRSPQVIPTTKYMHCEKSIKEATCVSILLLCLCLLLS